MGSSPQHKLKYMKYNKLPSEHQLGDEVIIPKWKTIVEVVGVTFTEAGVFYDLMTTSKGGHSSILHRVVASFVQKKIKAMPIKKKADH